MSVTALPFALTPTPGGVGSTSPVRAGSARADAEASDFGRWLQHAHGAAPAPRAAVQATPQTPPPRPSTAETRPPLPDRVAQPMDAAAAPAQADPDSPPAEDTDDEEPASTSGNGEPMAAWWWSPPEPPASPIKPEAGAEGPHKADPLSPAREGKAAIPTQAFELQTPRPEAPPEPPAAAPSDPAAPTLFMTEATEPPPAGAPLPSPPPLEAHGADAAGPGPMPWMVGAVTPAHATPRAEGTSAPPSATLATPVHDPDFPDALAQHITVLTRQGVHEAQLHLRPADMGTVSIHIAIAGQQAQVEFAASASATRAALEASFSHLAAALHEAGLTLTGGGVSGETLPRRQAPSDTPGAAGRPSDEPTPTPVAGVRTRIAPLTGRLDLYV